jgi:hypothetical protein
METADTLVQKWNAIRPEHLVHKEDSIKTPYGGVLFTTDSLVVKIIDPDYIHLFDSENLALRELADEVRPFCEEWVESFLEEDDTGFIVTKFLEGYRSLWDAMVSDGKWNPILRLKIMESLFIAVGTLHRSGMVHRDLKPDNIFYHPETGQVKLIDFGSALQKRELGQDHVKPFLGAREYACLDPTANDLTWVQMCANDLWSLGVCCFQLLCEHPDAWRLCVNEWLQTEGYSMTHPEDVQEFEYQFVAPMVIPQMILPRIKARCEQQGLMPGRFLTLLQRDVLGRVRWFDAYVFS